MISSLFDSTLIRFFSSIEVMFSPSVLFSVHFFVPQSNVYTTAIDHLFRLNLIAYAGLDQAYFEKVFIAICTMKHTLFL